MLETQQVQTVHTLENNQLINALELAATKTQKLEQKQKDLQRELTNTRRRKGDQTEAVNKLNRAMDSNSKELDQNRRAYIRQAAGMKESEMTGKSLKNTLKLLRIEQDTLGRSSDAYTRNLREQTRVQAELASRSTRTATSGGMFSNMGKNMPSLIAGAAGGLAVGVASQAVDRVISGVGRLVTLSAELSDEQADIRKTTGLTQQGVEQLETALAALNTRTTREDLRALATEAGKLGIQGVENVAKFVEEADKIKVALGEDLGADAVLQLGKISNAYKVEMLNIASAINSLGANSEAGEQYLVDFAARLAGTAVTAKVSAPEILGYGAVLDSLGLQVEMSGTALSNFFIDFVKDSAKFEKASGMVGGSLKEMIGEKGTNAGFISFLENLKASSKSSEDFLNKLSDIGIDGSRGAAVFLTLANNVEMVKEQQALANAEYTKGTSVLDEFNTKNTTTAAILDKIGNWWAGFWQNGAIKGFVDTLVFGFAKMIGVVSDADLAMQDFFEKKAEFEENEKSLNSLMGRHEALKAKVQLSKEEQDELKTVISQITALVPGAGTAFDQYGTALDINRGKVNDFIAVQKQLLLFNNKEAIQITEKEIVMNDARLKSINKLIQSGKELRVSAGTGGGALYSADLTTSEIQKLESERRQLADEIQNTKIRLDGLRGDYMKIQDANATPSRSGLSRPTTATTTTTTTTTVDGNSVDPEKVKNPSKAAEKKQTQLKAEEKKLLELKAELAVQSNLQDAEGLDRQLLIQAAAHQKKLLQIAEQFGEEKNLNSQQKQIIAAEKVLEERNYTSEVDELHEKHQKQQKEQIEAAQNEAATLIVNGRIAALKAELENAEGSNDLVQVREMMLLLSYEKEDNAIADVSAKYAKETIAAKDNATALAQIALNKEQEITQITDQYANERNVILAASNNAIIKSGKEAVEKDSKTKAELLQKQMESYQQIANYFMNAMSSIIGLMNAISERQSQSIEQNANKEMDVLENKRAAGILTETQYAAQKVSLEEKTNEQIDQLRKKQAAREKAQAITTSIINTALAVMNALKGPPSGALATPFAIAAGITGAIQTAAIAATPIPYFSGGFTSHGTHAATLGEHGQEYVIPAWALNDPMVFDTVKLLEQKRLSENPYRYTSTTAVPPTTVGNNPSQSNNGNSTSLSHRATTFESSSVSNEDVKELLSKVLHRLAQPATAVWVHDAVHNYETRMSEIHNDAMK
jgi:TP901 family phage tail tape measure protein